MYVNKNYGFFVTISGSRMPFFCGLGYALLQTFYTHQGKPEQITSFPFPRRYAFTALWLTVVFSLFNSWGMLDSITNSSALCLWVTSILSGLLFWVFFLMEKIRDYSENPIEETYGNVPISAI